MRGVVTSAKMTGVVAVTVERFVIHPVYKRRLRRSKKFLAATPEKLNIGDIVEITETKPQSRRVRFAVTEVVTRVAVLPEVKEEKTAKVKKVKKVKTEKNAREENAPAA